MIEFKNVKLNIDSIDILNELSFVINDNSVTCFVGNKHTGKSSILRILAGINKNYYGNIIIDGKYLEDSDKKIAFVFDKKESNTNENVYEYLMFYGKLYNKTKYEMEKYIDKMLKYFTLMSYKYTDLMLLDNESYKLVQIIRAMIDEPDIVLFDNIFIEENGDYNDKINKFLNLYIGKKTFIFASRNLNNFEDICDNIGVLDAGNLVIFGNREEVYKRADLNKRIEVLMYDGMEDAINILKNDKNISNVLYENNKIMFSFDGDEKKENEILKSLLDANVKVYSFKKQNVTFEQLLGKFKDSSYAKY